MAGQGSQSCASRHILLTLQLQQLCLGCVCSFESFSARCSGSCTAAAEAQALWISVVSFCQQGQGCIGLQQPAILCLSAEELLLHQPGVPAYKAQVQIEQASRHSQVEMSNTSQAGKHMKSAHTMLSCRWFRAGHTEAAACQSFALSSEAMQHLMHWGLHACQRRPVGQHAAGSPAR